MSSNQQNLNNNNWYALVTPLSPALNGLYEMHQEGEIKFSDGHAGKSDLE